MRVREIKIEDAESLIYLIKEVEASSQFMMMDAGERKTTADQMKKQIQRMKETANSTIIVAEEDERLTGYLFAIGGSVNRTKHSAYIAVGISEHHRGKGIGNALFLKAEEWALNHGILRLELTAVTQNEAGVALYKKRGFEIEGTKRKSLHINGEFFEEYYMSKLL
ncbi:GNAT family N-acetyltransferase [Bacillus sp. SG-1]|uniref:GNAT family N-acetyltransferase n=1 Tax=Bacillus sp. SG-1 TaxID=161544 RepID=UPI0001544EE0|nr:GNAT family N-acetyltransferase [Bacillus sp. SG-1]EDL64510.1 acetyltransferase, GNAT family protein [Bacillus sp. SG-1]